MLSLLEACHSSPVGGNHGRDQKNHNIFQCGYYWQPIYQDAAELVISCDICLRQGAISRFHEFLMTPILEVELLDVWGIDFMGPFVSSYGQKYILVAVDYVSKWVEVVALPKNDGKSAATFLRRIFFQELESLELLLVMVVLIFAT